MEGTNFATCIAIPIYNRLDLIQSCLNKLAGQILADNSYLLLVDDGSSNEVQEGILKNPVLQRSNVFYIRHEKNRGVAVARNTSIQWCRAHGIDLVIMVDSDCDIPSNFVEKHIELHKQYPKVACFGCGINGVGSGYWATVDKIMSWAPSVPKGKVRELSYAYSPPSANISFKMNSLPSGEKVFNENLETGEDVLLIRELRKNREKIYFSPEPCVNHFDRDTMQATLRHAYSWGKHIYFVQLGNSLSERCFNKWYRIIFFFSFLLAIIPFAALGLIFTIKPWFNYKPSYVLYSPAIFLLWLVKGVAILKMALNPYEYIPCKNQSVPTL